MLEGSSLFWLFFFLSLPLQLYGVARKKWFYLFFPLFFTLLYTPFCTIYLSFLTSSLPPLPFIKPLWGGIGILYIYLITLFPLPPYPLRRFFFPVLHSLIGVSILMAVLFYPILILKKGGLSIHPAFFLGTNLFLILLGIRDSRKVVLRKERIVRDLPREIRVGVLSDLHIGPWIGKEEVEKRVDLLLKEEPHLIFLLGDFLTEGVSEKEFLFALNPLRKLPKKAPTFAILGNHDLHKKESLKSLLFSYGIFICTEKPVRVEIQGTSCEIIGISYEFPPRKGREKLTSLSWGTPSLKFLLLHSPFQFSPRRVPPKTIAFAGHLHGGQIGIRWGSLHFSILDLFRIPHKGVVEKDGKLLLISGGAGFYGFPLRIGIPNEVNLLTILPRRSRSLL